MASVNLTPNQATVILPKVEVEKPVSHPFPASSITPSGEVSRPPLSIMDGSNHAATTSAVHSVSCSVLQASSSEIELKTQNAKSPQALPSSTKPLRAIFKKYGNLELEELLGCGRLNDLKNLAYFSIINKLVQNKASFFHTKEKLNMNHCEIYRAVLVQILASNGNADVSLFKQYAIEIGYSEKECKEFIADFISLSDLDTFCKKDRDAYHLLNIESTVISQSAYVFAFNAFQQIIHHAYLHFSATINDWCAAVHKSYLTLFHTSPTSATKRTTSLTKDSGGEIVRCFHSLLNYLHHRLHDDRPIQSDSRYQLTNAISDINQRSIHFSQSILFRLNHLQIEMHKVTLVHYKTDTDKFEELLIDLFFIEYFLLMQEALLTFNAGLEKIESDLQQQSESTTSEALLDTIGFESILEVVLRDVTSHTNSLDALEKSLSEKKGSLSSAYIKFAELLYATFESCEKKQHKFVADLKKSIQAPLPQYLSDISLTTCLGATLCLDFKLLKMVGSTNKARFLHCIGKLQESIIIRIMSPDIPWEIFQAKKNLQMRLAKTHGQTKLIAQLNAFNPQRSLSIPTQDYAALPIFHQLVSDGLMNFSNAYQLDQEFQNSMWFSQQVLLLLSTNFQQFLHTMSQQLFRSAATSDLSWLDTIDDEKRELETTPTTAAEVIEEGDVKEDAARTTKAVMPLSSIALPVVLPKTASGVVSVFKDVLTQFYGLHRPYASPVEVSKMTQTPKQLAMRQQLFALDSLQSILEMREICKESKQKQLLTTFLFLWEHQAIEQGLTCLYLQQMDSKVIPHALSLLLTGLGIAGDYQSAKENDNAPHYFRYPFVGHHSTSLALQHILKPTSTSCDKLSAELPVWLKEVMSLTISTVDQNSNLYSSFKEAIDTLSAQLTTSEADLKTQHAKRPSLNPTQEARLQKGALLALNKPLAHLIANTSPWVRFSVERIQRLNNIVSLFDRMALLIDLFKQNPSRSHLFLHALMMQIITQYLVENIGAYLSLEQADPMYTHYLSDYCVYYQLDSSLTHKQKAILESIDLGKASEYLFKRSPKVGTKAHERMKKFSDLYSHCKVDEGFAPLGDKPKSLQTLQQEVVEDFTNLIDLAMALIQSKLLNNDS